MKKMFAALLMLVMLVMLAASAMAFPADQVRIGSTMLYSGNYLESGETTVTTTVPASGKYAYFKDSVLTLNNFDYTGYAAEVDGERYVINTSGDLTIVVNAGTTNTIHGSFSTQNIGGIKAGNITISGTGTLNALSDNGAGICHAKSIEVSDATVTVEGYNSALITSQSAGKRMLTVNSGSLRLISQNNIVVPKPEDLEVVLGEGMRAYGSWSSDGSSKEPYKSTSTLYKYIEIVKGPDPEIWVGGVGMVGGEYLANGAAVPTTSKPFSGYAYYQDGVLTLNNYSYTGAGYAYSETASAIVYTDKELELVLEGTNALKAVPKSSDQNAYGVYTSGVSADLTIKENGTGSLTVDDAYAAVFCDGSLTIDGGVVIANKAISKGIRAGWGLEINNGEIKIVNAKGYGIESRRSMSVKGGKVTVTADGVGIQAHLGMFVSGGDVEVTSYNTYGINDGANNTGFAVLSGSLKTTGKDHGACLDGSTLTIKGGYFEAVSTGDSDYAINIKASSFSYDGATVQASIEPDDTLGEYVKENNNQYDRVVVKAPVKYTVTFDSDGGSAVAAQTVVEGEKATKPADPTRSGYTFKGWTLGGAAYDFTAAVTGSITLKAKWEKDAEIYVGGVGMVSGDYLANNATAPTTTKPTTGGYAYYKDGVLTLHDYSYTGAGYNYSSSSYAMVYQKKKLELVLEGSSSLKYSGADNVRGIYGFDGYGSFSIKGSGSLNISTTGTGIATGNPFIEGGSLTITTDGYGISCDNMEVNGGSVTVNAQGKGVYCNYSNTITAGTLKVTSKDRAIDVFEGGVNIDGGKVEVESTGDDGINVESSVHITDGSLWAKGANEGVDGMRLTIDGGEATVISVNTAADDDYRALNGMLKLGAGLSAQASTEPDGTNPETYDSSKHGTYDWIRIEPKEYTVTVENGTGGGDYAAGEKVTIIAPDVSGKVFKEWTSEDGVTFADPASTKTTFVMPEKAVTVTATYNTIVSFIDLSGITMPVVGAMPDTSFTISTPGVDYGAETFWVRYDEANNKLEQQYPDATLVNNTPFRAGIYYKMQAEVWAKEGYIFTPETVIRYDGVELPVKDDANLKPNFRYPVIAEYRDRTAASIGWAVAEEDPDEDELYPVVITKVLKGISAKDLPEGTVFNFVVIDGNNGDTQESAVITREELIAGNGTASTTIMTKYKGGMRIGEEIASAQLSAYEWVGSVAVSGDAEYQEIDKAYDVKPFVCTGLIKPETGDAVVTYTNEYTPVKADLPKTGDDSHLALWLAMLGMAGAAMLMLRKRHEA